MSARFEMCTCGRHGRLIFAEKVRLVENCFRQHALIMIRTGIEMKLFENADAERLMQEVLASPLPTAPEEVDLSLLYRTELFNETLMAEVIGADDDDEVTLLEPEEIHEFLTDTVDVTEISPDFLLSIKEGVAGMSPQ